MAAQGTQDHRISIIQGGSSSRTHPVQPVSLSGMTRTLGGFGQCVQLFLHGNTAPHSIHLDLHFYPHLSFGFINKALVLSVLPGWIDGSFRCLVYRETVFQVKTLGGILCLRAELSL